MIAKEMFEKLNYIQSSEDFEEELVYNFISEDIEDYRYISFNKISKYIEISQWDNNFHLSLEELQAINKQIEELGWNKDVENKSFPPVLESTAEIKIREVIICTTSKEGVVNCQN